MVKSNLILPEDNCLYVPDDAEIIIDPDHAEKLADRWWRINNLYWITDEDGDRVKFKMRPAQIDFFEEMWWRNIILKSRQHGFTTAIDIFGLDLCLFNSNIRAGIIAHTKQAAQAIFQDKVKYPYNNLPPVLRGLNRLLPEKDQSGELRLKNNSSMRVDTSLRSGTYQFFHGSEHGKICSKYPEKATEIRTGTLPTCHNNAYVFIESTAEGDVGDFHTWCTNAMEREEQGVEPTRRDMKFHFKAWFEKPENRLSEEDTAKVEISEEMHDYFDGLQKSLKVTIALDQRAWYVKEKETQQEYMMQEHPSTPEEAFTKPIEGAYYGKYLLKASAEGRIMDSIKVEPLLPVHTFWDLGIHDYMSIWFAQIMRGSGEIRLVDYYQFNNEGFPHYINWMKKRAKKRGFTYGMHFAPHDIAVRELSTGESRLTAAKKLGLKFEIVPAISIQAGIDLVRINLKNCYFDKIYCKDGISALKGYRKEWNDHFKMYGDKPVHDWTSHGSSAFKELIVAKEQGLILNEPVDTSKRQTTQDGYDENY